jgi:hypothetical protein
MKPSWAVALILAGFASAAPPPDQRPKVGDKLAPYTPTKAINQFGAGKCETC